MGIGAVRYHQSHCTNSFEWVKSKLDGSPDGAVFYSDTMDYARGRDGRKWQLYPGQLLLTILLKPSIITDQKDWQTSLMMALSVGFVQPLLAYGVVLKWPNDFMLGDKKLGGMLTQVIWKGGKCAGVIVGLGLNVHTEFSQDDELYKTATSLQQKTPKLLSIDALRDQLISSSDIYYQRWQSGEYAQIFLQWRMLQGYLGKTIVVHRDDGAVISGIVDTVETSGDIVLSAESGKKEIISFAHVVDTHLL